MLDAPLAVGFAAGMLATFNPCGFAMLPAYLSFFVGAEGNSGRAPGGAAQALRVGAAVTAGFVAVFGAAGVAITGMSWSVQRYAPWATLVIGLALVSLGLAVAAGRSPKLSLPRLQRGGSGRGVGSMALFGVSYDDARAYPVQIMIWHEIVNDVVGEVPVTVSYCPLCNSAVAYDRRVGTRLLDFGTSGRLYQSALVMYDRQTESLWSHFTGQAIAGALTGTKLELFPLATVSWADWRQANPDGVVLSQETGHRRDYGRNPYPGYDDVSTNPFLFEGKLDGRLAAKTRVVGIRHREASLAVLHDHVTERRVVDVELAGRRLVVWAKPGTASALDASELAEGRDVGATGVFLPAARGQELHFEAAGDAFTDRETGSTWDVLGRATAGPLAGETLGPVEHVDTFWFAWAAFQPDTTIVP